MTRQLLSVSIVTASIVAAIAVRPEAGQTNGPAARAASTAKPYVAPKTPWGDPDIQGGYTNKDENGIPLRAAGQPGGQAARGGRRLRAGRARGVARRKPAEAGAAASAAARPAPARSTGTSITARRTAAPGW